MVSQSPIDAARTRLRDALLAGQDTTPYRQAIAKLEAGAQSAQARARAAEQDAAAARTLAAQDRAKEIAATLQARIDAMLAQFPLPAAHLPGTEQ